MQIHKVHRVNCHKGESDKYIVRGGITSIMSSIPAVLLKYVVKLSGHYSDIMKASPWTRSPLILRLRLASFKVVVGILLNTLEGPTPSIYMWVDLCEWDRCQARGKNKQIVSAFFFYLFYILTKKADNLNYQLAHDCLA